MITQSRMINGMENKELNGYFIQFSKLYQWLVLLNAICIITNYNWVHGFVNNAHKPVCACAPYILATTLLHVS